ncbi:MAG: hypothetical protein KAW13_05435 [Dehalococcoidia bacterium]|nr:hypothetical protein [Dehalococcoidia bacterium]
MIRKHIAQSDHYFRNALGAIEAGNTEKASELLWGSIAQALKAVAARKGTELNSHGELRKYADDLAKELEDKSILRDFKDAESLHRNFYRLSFELEDVKGRVDGVRKATDRLIRLAEEPETE